MWRGESQSASIYKGTFGAEFKAVPYDWSCVWVCVSVLVINWKQTTLVPWCSKPCWLKQTSCTAERRATSEQAEKRETSSHQAREEPHSRSSLKDTNGQTRSGIRLLTARGLHKRETSLDETDQGEAQMMRWCDESLASCSTSAWRLQGASLCN